MKKRRKSNWKRKNPHNVGMCKICDAMHKDRETVEAVWREDLRVAAVDDIASRNRESGAHGIITE